MENKADHHVNKNGDPGMILSPTASPVAVPTPSSICDHCVANSYVVTGQTHDNASASTPEPSTNSATRSDQPQCILEKAARIVEEVRSLGPDFVAGIRDIQNLTLSIGLPATRVICALMVESGTSSGSDRGALLRRIAGITSITEVGSIRLEYFDRRNERADAVHFILGRCRKDHDLGEQLNKIRMVLPEDKWPDVLKHLSELVFLGRDVYRRFASHNQDLLVDICRFLPGVLPEDLLSLKVDLSNTTLYVVAGWGERIGIFVHIESELQAPAHVAT